MNLSALKTKWEEAWPEALAAWSRYTQLHPPMLCETRRAAQAEQLTGSFAMIRLQDQSVVVDLPEIESSGLGDYAVEILAHEIGHHVLAPATLTDHARCLALMCRALPTMEDRAPMVANLYTDLLINDRLQRSAGLRMDEIYRQLGKRRDADASSNPGAVWTLYLRIYELLWSLPGGSLGGAATTPAMEGDAWLGMRLVRSYASDWLSAAGKFASLLLPHLVEDQKAAEDFARLHDTRGAGAGGIQDGLTDASADDGDISHPSLDPRITGIAPEDDPDSKETPAPISSTTTTSSGQQRQPFEYAEILRAAGWPGTDHEAAIAYYRELAMRHLVRYPRRPAPESTEPLPEGLEPWDIGDPLDECDWFQSVLQSPHTVPGLTTVRRVYGTSPGSEPRREPIDLDLYVDSSGSMPNPAVHLSYPALAGVIIVLSALRSGARVHATLWSGKKQFQSTPGFIRDETEILRVLTAHYGGATQFPLHVLRETYANRRPDERPVHVLSISDDGVTTMFDDPDERSNPGWALCAQALAKGRGGGTLALNIPSDWERRMPSYYQNLVSTLRRARDEQGWHVHAVPTLDGLVAFARAFSRQTFGPDANLSPATR
ncbi:VWA domain-containing protein [Haloferula sargassicola]|uniref:VWA domain-containing protein n=1 Tax=Haloferula sargassicola TaxID=490096 RepID=A0ABP9UNB3_9BACT